MHLTIDKLWSKTLEKIFISICWMKATHSDGTVSIATTSKNNGLLFICKLLECRAKSCAGSQFVRGVFRPVRLTRSGRAIQDNLSLAFEYRLYTCGDTSQTRRCHRYSGRSRRRSGEWRSNDMDT